MSKLESLLALANEAAEESGVDLNVSVAGGGRLLPEGYAYGQLVEYIEFGNQPQEYGGKAKDPALEFTLGFALHGEGYTNEDGTPSIIRTYNTALSRNEKSNAFKLFKALNWKGTAKSFAQMLGQFFMVKIVHKARKDDASKKSARIDNTGFLPPLDLVTRKPYDIPSAPEEMFRLFLWNKPTLEAWASLYVEGKYDDGGSKNRVQETILSALDFDGSPLQQLLGGSSKAAPAVLALPTAPVTPVAPPAPVLPALAAIKAVAPVSVPKLPAVPALPVLPV